jgi:hypothetical protein
MALHKTLLLGLLLLSSTLPLAGCGESQSSASSITSLPEIASIDESEIVPAGTSTPAGVNDRPLVSSDFTTTFIPGFGFRGDVFVDFPHLSREQIPVTRVDLKLADKDKALIYEAIEDATWTEGTTEKGDELWYMSASFYLGGYNYFAMRYCHISVTGTVVTPV